MVIYLKHELDNLLKDGLKKQLCTSKDVYMVTSFSCLMLFCAISSCSTCCIQENTHKYSTILHTQ